MSLRHALIVLLVSFYYPSNLNAVVTCGAANTYPHDIVSENIECQTICRRFKAPAACDSFGMGWMRQVGETQGKGLGNHCKYRKCRSSYEQGNQAWNFNPACECWTNANAATNPSQCATNGNICYNTCRSAENRNQLKSGSCPPNYQLSHFAKCNFVNAAGYYAACNKNAATASIALNNIYDALADFEYNEVIEEAERESKELKRLKRQKINLLRLKKAMKST